MFDTVCLLNTILTQEAYEVCMRNQLHSLPFYVLKCASETDYDSEPLPASVSGVTADGWSFSLIWELEDDSDSELLSLIVLHC